MNDTLTASDGVWVGPLMIKWGSQAVLQCCSSSGVTRAWVSAADCRGLTMSEP